MKPPASCVLIADDEPHVRELLRDFLIGKGYAVVMVASGVEAPEAPCAPELRLLHRWLDGRPANHRGRGVMMEEPAV